MPARQRGFARKRGPAWLAGWYENGSQRTRGGFETRTEALDYAETKAAASVAVKAAQRFGDVIAEPARMLTVSELVDGFLARHDVDTATKRKLRSQLGHAVRSFGDRPLDTLTSLELDVWRSQLPARSRHYFFRAFRQTLEYAVGMGLLDSNPTARIRNRQASLDEHREQRPFDTWEQVEAASMEMDPRFAAIPVVIVGTGLRPEELFGLRRADIDLAAGVLSVERVYSQGRFKACKKSERQRRRVPLRARVVEAIEAMPRRIDTPLLFPAARGGPIDLEKFRHREWAPALRAAGIDHRRVYDCRHTFASWSIAAGMQLFYLARIMGTSVGQIDATYGHLMPDSEDYLRGILDDYDQRNQAAAATFVD
jgi:integrase